MEQINLKRLLPTQLSKEVSEEFRVLFTLNDRS